MKKMQMKKSCRSKSDKKFVRQRSIEEVLWLFDDFSWISPAFSLILSQCLVKKAEWLLESWLSD